ncbi:hypothetical protein EDC96DRAFT_571288 [Choanephora cucurbitarum]|nr:hypothetical protein EDC96DRAFT_571288 [Choanephora cucurbitarum]
MGTTDPNPFSATTRYCYVVPTDSCCSAAQGILRVIKTTSPSMKEVFGEELLKQFRKEKRLSLFGKPARICSNIKQELDDVLLEYDDNRDRDELEEGLFMLKKKTSGATARTLKTIMLLLQVFTSIKSTPKDKEKAVEDTNPEQEQSTIECLSKKRVVYFDYKTLERHRMKLTIAGKQLGGRLEAYREQAIRLANNGKEIDENQQMLNMLMGEEKKARNILAEELTKANESEDEEAILFLELISTFTKKVDG